jgi:transcriptional regulator with XRE-family HTH domain
MSQVDLELLKKLAVSQSEVARALAITPQAVSKGLKSQRRFFDTIKLVRLRDNLVEELGIEPGRVDRSVESLFPSIRAVSELSELKQTGIEIDSDVYIVANRFSYFRGRYDNSFSVLRDFILLTLAERRVILFFRNYSTMQNTRAAIYSWLGLPKDRPAPENLVYMCFPSVELLSFSIGGFSGKIPKLYFLSNDGSFPFLDNDEANSDQAVKALTHYVEKHPERVQVLPPPGKDQVDGAAG